MATTKKAAKKAAKKAVPKVEKPKQIILTQEQFDALGSIRSKLSTLSYELSDAFANDNDNVREIAFKIGVLQAKLDQEQAKLSDIETDIDPDPLVIDWSFDEDESDDDNQF